MSRHLHPAARRRAAARGWSLAQARMEARLMLRNGEQLLLAVVIPVIVLVGGVAAPTALGLDLDHAAGRRASRPGVLALAVMSTAFTSLAIATGFERRYGVHQAARRLAAAPVRAARRQGRRAAARRGAAGRRASRRSALRARLGPRRPACVGGAARRRCSAPPPSPRSGCSSPACCAPRPRWPPPTWSTCCCWPAAPSCCPSSAYGAFGDVVQLAARPARSARRCATPASTARSPGATSACCSPGPSLGTVLTARTFKWE